MKETNNKTREYLVKMDYEIFNGYGVKYNKGETRMVVFAKNESEACDEAKKQFLSRLENLDVPSGISSVSISNFDVGTVSTFS
ncbi:MAG: hypothetical protein IJY74_02220 [Oscillospiraceae bacterium]|nr:hypothetical protein [Oscillospiraceae bacterium]